MEPIKIYKDKKLDIAATYGPLIQYKIKQFLLKQAYKIDYFFVNH